MSKQFRLPDLGEGIMEGQILRLLVAEGDTVVEDQPLMEVETDKAAVEIPSPHAGVIVSLHVSEEQVVNVGELLVTYGETGAEVVPARTVEVRKSAAAAGAATGTAAPPARRKPASPAVRKRARALGLDIETIDGTGPGGRVVMADLVNASEPASVPPAAPPPAAKPQAEESPGKNDRDQWGPIRRQSISQMRKTIASVMQESTSTIPHVTDCDDADVTELDRLRHGYNDGAPDGGKLTMLAFVIRAVVRALQAHPIINASFDAQAAEIVYRRYYNVAIGVHTEHGLVAPVLRGADRMSVPQINEALLALVEKARRRTFTVEETRGGTYSISNVGAVGGSRYSTPIITPPQAAVLAVGRTRLRPWVVEGQVVPRLIMPLSHSMDHRIIDGADEVAFLKHLIDDLENPARLMF